MLPELPPSPLSNENRQRQERQLVLTGARLVPSLFLDAGPQAWFRVLEFFTARIRNRNTREAYARAVRHFSTWCAKKRLTLEQVNSLVVAAYIEELGTVAARPTVKQHLAAIRMLFDYLTTVQVMKVNPAAPVRGPKHVVRKGKTPVLSAEEARHLLDSIDVTKLIGLRDRALLAVMIFSFARIGAVVAMNVEDYFSRNKRSWFRLHEKGGKRHDVPAHTRAQEYMDAYLAAAEIGGERKAPVFRTFDRRRQLTTERLNRREALAMIKRRAKRAGLPATICCHTFRATGITTYLLNGGTLEKAQQIAAHESPRTTKLYDRTSDDMCAEEIEKIVV